MKKIALIVSALALTPAIAMADTTVDAKLSTLGYGAEVAFPIMEKVDGRIGLNKFNYSVNKNSNGTAFSGKLDLSSVEALADWHPWAGSFRVSGGLVYNNNKFSMTGLPNGANISVGGKNVAYNGAAGDYVTATVDFKKVVPYLGIGWGRTPKNTGLSFTSDIGILFQGSPRGNVTSNIAAAQPNLAQANADLNSSLNNFKMYPVISIGIGYTF
jgi:hypothetical protein